MAEMIHIPMTIVNMDKLVFHVQGHRGILSPAIGGAIQGCIHASLYSLHG